MSRYIPMPAYPDAMPVDISFVFEAEKPAGKHGFLRADGEVFRFEDGTEARFWGVNVNGGACFPDKDYAPKVAARLAQAGCNIVRFHQLDAEWDTPNIFAYSKGRRVKTTRVMDARSLDHLDYFIHCLKENGIYCYLDMMTYRKFKEGDDVPFCELLMDSAKPWSIVNPRLIELQKEFAFQIWNHYNPYTKLAYKDDPVFVMTEITNECDLFRGSQMNSRAYASIPYYENEFRGMFRDWLQERQIDFDWEHCDLYCKDDPMIRFKLDLTRSYYRQMRDYMRDEIGVKIPITGTNWENPGIVCSHDEMDFADSHHYFYDWQWGNTERICANQALSATPPVLGPLGKMRLPNKPFFISEWDVPWPNTFRAESPIHYAAVGALQGWSGFAIHTYSYNRRLETGSILGRELSSPVAGVPYREGIFSTWNDPAKFGLFYHAALITRRGDVSPARKKLAVTCENFSRTDCTAFQGGIEQHQMATSVDGTLPEGYDQLLDETETVAFAEPGKIVSDNGQLWRDLKRRVGAVDTDRTKVVYGRIGPVGQNSSKIKHPVTVQLDGMTVEGETDFGVIALSSLTDDPIETSDNMLLSAIGRARNSGAQFDGEKMLEVGHAPIQAEVVTARVSIRTALGDKLKVWGVNAEGFYAGCLATTYENGVLSFEIGDPWDPACYYLIVKE